MFVAVPLRIDSETRSHKVTHEIGITSAGFTVVEHQDTKVYRPNGLEDYQLLYIKEGKGYFTFNDKETVINAGNVIIYKPFEPQIYRFELKDKPKTFWIHIGGSYFDKISKELNLEEKQILKIIDDQDLLEAINATIDELTVQKEGYSYAAISYAIKAFIIATRNEFKNQDSSAKHVVELTAAKIRKYYIDEKTNLEYANEAKMSVSHFMRLFKNLTGTTPQKYKSQMRIAVAKNILLNTNYKIGEVSQMVGFNDPMYFCRYFHKTVGCSPSEYRAKN